MTHNSSHQKKRELSNRCRSPALNTGQTEYPKRESIPFDKLASLTHIYSKTSSYPCPPFTPHTLSSPYPLPLPLLLPSFSVFIPLPLTLHLTLMHPLPPFHHASSSDLPVCQLVRVGPRGAHEGCVIPFHQQRRAGPQSNLRREVDAKMDGAERRGKWRNYCNEITYTGRVQVAGRCREKTLLGEERRIEGCIVAGGIVLLEAFG